LPVEVVPKLPFHLPQLQTLIQQDPKHEVYTEEHEWLDEEMAIVTVVGITDHAAEELGRHRLRRAARRVGTEVSKDDDIVVIESVKAASDILAPIDGEIVEVNSAMTDNPGKVNEDPQGEGWFFKMKASRSRPDGRPTWTKPAGG
jgi:glycine cleavage system H protein